jgi:hypothetical protein
MFTELVSIGIGVRVYQITTGIDQSSYFHEHFLPFRPHLLANVRRVKGNGSGQRARSNPSDEPNFYEMPFLKPINLSASESKPRQHLERAPNGLLPSTNNESILQAHRFSSRLGSLLATNRSILDTTPYVYGCTPSGFLTAAVFNADVSVVQGFPLVVRGNTNHRLASHQVMRTGFLDRVSYDAARARTRIL